MENPNAPPQPKSNAWKWIVAACCGCLLLAGAAAGGLGAMGYFAATKIIEPAKAVATAFLSDVAKKDYAGAHAQLSSQFQSSMSVEGLQALFEKGSFKITGASGVSVRGFNATPDLIDIKGSFQNGAATSYFKFHLVPEAGTWKIQKFSIEPTPVD